MAICQHPDCGKEFTPRPQELQIGRGQFCSSRCWGLSRDMATLLNTPHLQAKAIAHRRTSPKIGHKVTFVCSGCGVEFDEYPCNRTKPLKFHNRACADRYKRQHKMMNVDTEPTVAKPQTAGLTIVYDPLKREIRNE